MKPLVAIPVVTVLAAAGAVCMQGRVAEPEVAAEPVAVARDEPESDERAQPKAPAPKERVRREPRKPRALQVGMKGPDVKELQRKLAQLTYDPGPADGSFGYMTQHAVLAFEKVHELEPDGIVDLRQAKLMSKARPPEPHDHGLGSYVDIDIGNQVLYEVVDGKVAHTLPVSTANGAVYESRSGPAIASTPRGQFQIYSKTSGWRTSYLGSLYSPSYFYGGYAIHGSASVPPYPASHGCVRIPMHSADDFFARNPTGTEVILHD